MPEPAVVQDSTILNEPVPEPKMPEQKLYPEGAPKPEVKPDEKPETPKAEAKPEEKPADKKPDVPPEKKAEEAKPSETPKPEAKPASPEAGKEPPKDYELTLPKGSLLSPDDLAKVQKDAKAAGLTKDQADGILQMRDEGAKSLKATQDAILVKAREEWKAACEKDPLIGGEKFAQNAEIARRAWDKVADAELKTLAEQTGFGNHPAVVRMMVKIGQMFSEDQLVRGSTGAVARKKSPEEILYGGTTPNPNEPMN